MHDNLHKSLRRKTNGAIAPVCRLSVVMPTVTWSGTFEACARRVLELMDATPGEVEFLAVLDGEASPPPSWLVRDDVTILSTGRRSGPAIARNLAAEAARGDILLFVDSDVELDDAAFGLIRSRFAADASLVAIFGTYDDEPAAIGTASQFRNLLHHHTHMTHPGKAHTFWAGCGAIRTAKFRTSGGFDRRYRFPSIEDIELGTRLAAHGDRIELDRSLRCKHHKSWTIRSMIHTDIVYRAVPWTRLMMNTSNLPPTLAIDIRNRACGVLAILSLASLPVAWLFPWALAVTLACLAGLFFLNLGFYRLCYRKRGLAFAGSAFALHVMFFTYASLTFAAVVLHDLRGRSDRQSAWLEGRVAVPVTERS